MIQICLVIISKQVWFFQWKSYNLQYCTSVRIEMDSSILIFNSQGEYSPAGKQIQGKWQIYSQTRLIRKIDGILKNASFRIYKISMKSYQRILISLWYRTNKDEGLITSNNHSPQLLNSTQFLNYIIGSQVINHVSKISGLCWREQCSRFRQYLY